MIRVRHRVCTACDISFEYLAETKEIEQPCPECKSTKIKHQITAPRVTISDSESAFVPHFDYQLGRHYESHAEKEAHLKSMGKTQLGGFASPKDSYKQEAKGRPIMTRTQFQRWRAERKAKARRNNLDSMKQQVQDKTKELDGQKKIVVPVHN